MAVKQLSTISWQEQKVYDNNIVVVHQRATRIDKCASTIFKGVELIMNRARFV
ncbi:MAG TPA: hypothetical protein VEH06_15530 [Candidatus Bathyarchaeia archaeon]|nr:hypothetical protein [Candidatus Bathyarchaeia archaeon]